MKLKCTAHDRRVMVLDTEKVIHRSDGTYCEGTVKIGSYEYTPLSLLLTSYGNTFDNCSEV